MKHSKHLFYLIFWGALMCVVCPQCLLANDDAKNSNTTFTERLHAARTKCWSKNFSADHTNVDIIECENSAIISLTKNEFNAANKIILRNFLRQRLLIAAELDHHRITLDQYQVELSKAATDFESQINGSGI